MHSGRDADNKVYDFDKILFASDGKKKAIQRNTRMLGLRSLFFLLIKVVERFYLLKIGVSVLLGFVGLNLMTYEWLAHIGCKPVYSLYVIAGTLAEYIVFNPVSKRRTPGKHAPPLERSSGKKIQGLVNFVITWPERQK